MNLSTDNGPRFGRFKNGKGKKSDPKNLFRQSIKWKNFRTFMLKQNNCHCEICACHYSGKRLTQLQVHHLDPDNYEILNPASFSVLCSSCHDFVERLVTMIKGEKWALPKKYRELWALFGPHLSKAAREKFGGMISRYEENRRSER